MHPLSASRLNHFLGCTHAAALWLAGVKPEGEADATLELIRAKGFEHEAEVLARLEVLHGPAVRIPAEGTHTERAALTAEAIKGGAALIYQAALSKDAWLGYPDFLVRRPGQAPVFEPEDAKLSRKAKGEYLLQLGIYAELLDAVFGIKVQGGAVHVAAGEPAQFDLRRTRYILKRLMRRFERFVSDEARSSKAIPCAACEQCDYKRRCIDEWRKADSPFFVAGLEYERWTVSGDNAILDSIAAYNRDDCISTSHLRNSAHVEAHRSNAFDRNRSGHPVRSAAAWSFQHCHHRDLYSCL